tara:strand:+ start:305 stop:478 length:174 start_codon:yes stop_codon:yes gene_type:complete
MNWDFYIGMYIMLTGIAVFMLALFDGGKGMGLVAIGAAACAIGGCKVMIDARLGDYK